MRICIVGGGTAAACLVMALARALGSRPVDLVIVEPSDQLWRGRAYRMDRDEIVVNAPPTMMTLNPNDPQHAQRWLARHHGESCSSRWWTQESFPPRHVYGRYLEETLSQTLDGLAASGWRVEWLHRRAVSVALDGHKTLVGLEDGATVPCDYTVLCVGEPSEPFGYDPYELAGHPSYISRPYPVASTLGTIHPSASVAVIGCGLTAVDTVLGLRAQSHQGRITLLSRDGILAAVRRPRQVGRPSLLTPETVRDRLERSSSPLRLSTVAALAREEALRAGATPGQIASEMSMADWGLRRVRRQLTDREHVPNVDWLQVATWALITTVHYWWPALPRSDRQQFLRRYHRLWASFTSPMPAATANTLVETADSGQLQVLRGLQKITPAEQGFRITAQHDTVEADVVIAAATAPPAAHPATPDELMDAVIRNGCGQQHPDGGLRVQPETGRLIDRSGRPQPSLLALGHLTSGTHYYLSGIPMLVWRSEAVAAAIAADASPSMAPPPPGLLTQVSPRRVKHP
ncbi:FAD/NAD(P)-binding protein [Streptomyces sp. ASQP_92]|uniref:FAD/NAD(P)-binding protein n=1 Tax=Streptomyces sp. ASQP_92 TaxID=2979116 RepID=UPI0021BE7746|nr:FAD/NAD(P)-binding protein [Streptomyces sp. ASQP_92]MCT9094060.1 FAD/NAD(P)-binding protein [Streptomyces sp. ASQP_92]